MIQTSRAPDDSDFETELLRAAVEEARREVRRGEVIPHERVREWLLDLARGELAEPPTVTPPITCEAIAESDPSH